MGADPIDWEGLAESCGTLHDHGETGGDRIGREAIAQILGADALRSAVDHYVNHRRGSALARSVLGVLRPAEAIRHCLEIYAGQGPIEARRSAVELLSSLGSRQELGLVKRFLEDPDGDIQAWGAKLLKQLVFAESVAAEEAEDSVRFGEGIENPGVRRAMSRIRDFLSRQ
jgi:HEAT repeat protein